MLSTSRSRRCRSKAQKPTISLPLSVSIAGTRPQRKGRRSRAAHGGKLLARQGGSVRDTAWHQFPSDRDRDHLPVVALLSCYVVAPR
jgi:hypothetical protein